MGQLSDSALLAVWEEGAAAHPLDRALGLIAAVEGTSRAELARLPIDSRDRRLFGVAEAVFGPELRLLATCDACGAETEVSFAAAAALAVEAGADRFDIAHDGERHACRMPDSRDLAAALRAPDPRGTLLSRLVEAETPSPALLDAVETALERRAGLAALTIAHGCAECGAEATSPFDILDYLWRRIAAQAQRLLWDIHLLASAYGWTSAEILGLGARRRATHVAMVAS